MFITNVRSLTDALLHAPEVPLPLKQRQALPIFRLLCDSHWNNSVVSLLKVYDGWSFAFKASFPVLLLDYEPQLTCISALKGFFLSFLFIKSVKDLMMGTTSKR